MKHFRRPIGPFVARILLGWAIVATLIVALPRAIAQEVPGDVPENTLPMPNRVAGGVAPLTAISAPGGNAAAPGKSPFDGAIQQLPDLTSRANFGPALQLVILLTVLSLAPAILIMMTSFTRIVIVLSLLRQALGTQQLPPNQVMIGLALFMTFIVMGPTWKRVNNEALQPYMEQHMDQRDAMAAAVVPLREFMQAQIQKQNGDEDVLMLCRASGYTRVPANWGEVDTMTLIPAFMLSELKTAFYMGFKIYLPFLIVDMVVSSVLISMGMMMLPPALISLPFKLLLFVLVDGWRLIADSLIGSFVT